MNRLYTAKKKISRLWMDTLNLTFPIELSREILSYLRAQELKQQMISDQRSSHSFRGEIWYGFTKYRNSHVVAFAPPTQQEVVGNPIAWKYCGIHQVDDSDEYFNISHSVILQNSVLIAEVHCANDNHGTVCIISVCLICTCTLCCAFLCCLLCCIKNF